MISLGRKEQYVILVIIAVIVFGLGAKFALAKSKTEKPVILAKSDVQEEKKKALIYVHVSGAVQKPGLYSFQEGQRVQDALTKAVPNDQADCNALNLAERLTDGSKIIVPARGQPAQLVAVRPVSSQSTQSSRTSTRSSAAKTTTKGLAPGEKININTADAAQLDKLPGIGLSTACKIIDYRNANNGFKSIEEIKKVQGIGDKKFNDIMSYIVI